MEPGHSLPIWRAPSTCLCALQAPLHTIYVHIAHQSTTSLAIGPHRMQPVGFVHHVCTRSLPFFLFLFLPFVPGPRSPLQIRPSIKLQLRYSRITACRQFCRTPRLASSLIVALAAGGRCCRYTCLIPERPPHRFPAAWWCNSLADCQHPSGCRTEEVAQFCLAVLYNPSLDAEHQLEIMIYSSAA
jgi:hypothetical protein